MEDIEPYSPGLRAGNTQRQAALNHVERMLKSGHLDGEEAGKRANTITNAKMEGEIKLAVSDLPEYRPPLRQVWQRFDWDKRTCYTPVLLLAMMLSVAFAGVPFIIAGLAGYYHDNSVLTTATGVVAIVIGAIGFIASLIALCSKLDS